MQIQAATFDIDPDAPMARSGAAAGAGLQALGGLSLVSGAALRLAATASAGVAVLMTVAAGRKPVPPPPRRRSVRRRPASVRCCRVPETTPARGPATG